MGDWERYRFATLTWVMLAIIVAAGLGFGVGQVLGEFGSSPQDGTVSKPVGAEPVRGVQSDAAKDAAPAQRAPQVRESRENRAVPARDERTTAARRKRALAARERGAQTARARARATPPAAARKRARRAAAKRPPVAVVTPRRRVVVPPPPQPPGAAPPSAPKPAPQPALRPTPQPLGGAIFDDSG
jgi:hypothetical protein